MKHCKIWQDSKERGTLVLAFMAALAVLLLAATPVLAEDDDFDSYSSDNFCSQTSKAALRACRHEIKDDFWIAIGICNNLSDAEERSECLVEAKADKQEGMEECREQLDARLEVCNDLGEAPYDPQADPADFVDPLLIGDTVAPNPYLPLIPGSVWVYQGGDETITVSVTDEVKEIRGIPCIVVRDVAEEDGEVIEATDDWFAQDLAGNVWYFGEISLNFEDGELVDIEGSWKAGEEGDKQGILMKRYPQVGDVYRQEFSLGDAEDMAKVISLLSSADTPAAGCTGNCLETEEYTPIEPDVLEYKYYAPGIGMILEVDPETGERVELISFDTP